MGVKGGEGGTNERMCRRKGWKEKEEEEESVYCPTLHFPPI